MGDTHSSVSAFVTPAVFFAAFVVVGLIVAARKEGDSAAEFAMVSLIGVPGLYLGAIASPLHLPILWLPAIILCAAAFGYQVYLFKRDLRRRRARQEDD